MICPSFVGSVPYVRGWPMNRHTMFVLEFEKVLDAVARRATTPMGRDHLLSLTPRSDPVPIRRELMKVSELQRLMAAHPEFLPPLLSDPREALHVVELDGSVLSTEELYEVLVFMSSSRTLASKIDSLAEPDFAYLATLGPRLPVEAQVEERLSALLDADGKLRDLASPRLGTLRARLRSSKGRVVRELERYMAGLPETYRVEGASVSVRDGHYVVPVRREGKSHVGGIVRGKSASGATLFIEPPLALRLLAEITELEHEEHREVQRILREATEWVRPLRDRLADGFLARVELDSLWARALTAVAWNAVAPDILELGHPDADLRIREGRHPLLIERGDEAVPFSLDLTADERVVIVSGPNTGGKTVLLKALGLIPLLAQSGVVPPVGDGTRLPVLSDIFADIGDEQSIAESLSTFSAHVKNVREILAEADGRAFVLLDELGSGTDPAEGSALARVVLEALVESGARAFVTSHLGSLKRLDEEGAGIVNASLLFDAKELVPTFVLRKGRPGRSFGLAIARRLGFPAELLDRAESYVGSEEMKLEALLETLEGRERDLKQSLAEAEAVRAEARDLHAEVQARSDDIEQRERSLEAKAREQARELLLEARQEVEAAIGELRLADPTEVPEAAARARRRVEDAARAQRERIPANAPRPYRGLPPVSVGDRARIRESGSVGVVREIRDDRVAVEVGGVRIQLPRDEIESVHEGSELPFTRGESRGFSRWDGLGSAARHEVDLRGYRVDEAAKQLDRAIDAAVVGNLSEIRIIHGMGTGAVKARSREILLGDSRVESFRPGGHGEGGTGVTIATLR